jgi:hypothetical protein
LHSSASVYSSEFELVQFGTTKYMALRDAEETESRIPSRAVLATLTGEDSRRASAFFL